MGICSWIIFGFFAGLIGRALMPGTQKMGLIATTLLGVGGAFVGGFLASLLSGRDPRGFQPSGFIGAVVGTLILLVVAAILRRRR